MNSYIKVKNFRKYLETPKIDLKDLNILVGTNSSGKSSLVKAYILITKFIQSDKLFEIDFTSDYYKDLNINDFEKLKCKYSSDEDNILIELGVNDFIFSLTLTKHTKSNIANVLKYEILDITNDIVYEYKFAKGNKFTEYADNGSTTYLNENLFKIKLVNNHKYKEQVIKFLEFIISNQNDFINKSLFEKQLKVVEDTIEFPDSIVNFPFIIDSFKETIKLPLNNMNEISSFKLNTYYSNNFKDLTFDDVVNFSPNLSKIMIDYRLYDLSRIKNNFTDKEFSFESNFFEKLLESKSGKLTSEILKINTTILPLAFRKYTNLNSIIDKSNDLAQLIHQYYSAKDDIKIKVHEFIKYWISKDQFNIGDDFEINFYGGEAYEVIIYENGVKIPLNDKGTGNIQIFKILLLVGAIFRNMYHSSTIILEEPELNLHPSMQSKLADLILGIKDFWPIKMNVIRGSGIRFIIETHSEYLIRRLQILAIQNKLDSDKIGITYFPTEMDQDPYNININTDGSLDKNFGPGFFDEASNHTLELIKFKRLSQN